MRAIVWKVSKEMPSKWNPGFTNQVVVFKSIEDDKQYKLNLDSRFKNDCDRWKLDLQEGNVLEVRINGETKNIDLFNHHSLVERKQQSLIKQVETAEGYELGTEKCDCIKQIIKKLQEHEAHGKE